MWFGLLGALAVRDDTGAARHVSAAKQRVILAALLLRANETVSRDELVRALWDDRPPRNAASALRVYVTRLRRALGDAGGRIAGVPSGYRIDVAGPAELDVWRVNELQRAGFAAAKEGRAERAAEAFREAEGAWRGDPLVDVPSDALAVAHLAHLEELRLRITEARLDADLRRGRAEEVVGELRALAAAHPLREHLHGRLMTALALSGRQAEASAVYQGVRRALVDELGAEPGERLRAVHQAVLEGRAESLLGAGEGEGGDQPDTPGPAPVPDPDPDPHTPERDPATPAPDPGPDPADPGSAPGSDTLTPPSAPAPPRPPVLTRSELPPSVADFTGRAEELERLAGLLPAPEGPAAALVLVTGPGGIGKSALAVRAAHHVRDRFPDGRIWLDLGGGARPVSPDDALTRLLLDLGTASTAIPAGTEARSALLRSLLDGRRVLLVLDNARDAAQVRPLLPAASGCAALVTSRSQLADLEGASRLDLAVLPTAAAHRLLARIAGETRVAAEPEAARDVLQVCAGLPLAVRIAAARLAGRTSWSVRHLAELLRDRDYHLDELQVGDLGLRSCFEAGYVHLAPGAARAFRLLGALDQPRTTAPVIAALLNTPARRAALIAEELVSANLLESHEPGQYRFHDLVGSYARELAVPPGQDDERPEAVRRVVTWYTHTARNAELMLSPGLPPVTMAPLPEGVTPLGFRDDVGALAWCEAERHNVLAVGRTAARFGLHSLGWQLPARLWMFYYRRSYMDDMETSHAAGLECARLAGEKEGQGVMHNGLAQVAAEHGKLDLAYDHLEQVRALYRAIGHRTGESMALGNMGTVAEMQHEYEKALEIHLAGLAMDMAPGGNDMYRSIGLNNVGSVYVRLGRYEEALDMARQSLEFARKLGNRHQEIFAFQTLGRAFLGLDDLGAASGELDRALVLARELGDRANEAYALGELGTVSRRSGDDTAALERWRRSVTLYEELGDPRAADVRELLRSLVGVVGEAS